MNKQSRKVFGIATIALAVFVIGFIIASLDAPRSVNTNKQTVGTLGLSTEQDIEATTRYQENLSVQPDINNQEFILTGSAISCSTAQVNGQTSHLCSGNIRIVPAANDTMSPGLYKIDEHTRLLHDGQEQNLNTLHELSQNQTKVRLALADGSEQMLKEIRY